jgi:hypothetical protein
MGRTLDQIIAELPPDRLERVEARCQELRRKVEGLAGKAQAGNCPPSGARGRRRKRARRRPNS